MYEFTREFQLKEELDQFRKDAVIADKTRSQAPTTEEERTQQRDVALGPLRDITYPTSEFEILAKIEGFSEFELESLGKVDEPHTEDLTQLAHGDHETPVASKYLQKILDTMHGIQRGVYFSQVSKCGEAYTFSSLLLVLRDMREKLGTIPKVFRDSVYLCLYTKFLGVSSKYGVTEEEGYKLYHDNLMYFEDHVMFLSTLRDDWLRYISDSALSESSLARLRFELKTFIHECLEAT